MLQSLSLSINHKRAMLLLVLLLIVMISPHDLLLGPFPIPFQILQGNIFLAFP
jgi:hypothetical protein